MKFRYINCKKSGITVQKLIDIDNIIISGATNSIMCELK